MSTNDFTDNYKESVEDNTSARHTHTNKSVLDDILISDIIKWNNKGTYSKPSEGIPSTDMTSAVQTSLAKADTALQSYTEQYTGTITSVKMNGLTISTSGEADLGIVITSHQDITGKLDTSKVKNTNSTTAGDVYDVRYINTMLGNIESLLAEV